MDDTQSPIPFEDNPALRSSTDRQQMSNIPEWRRHARPLQSTSFCMSSFRRSWPQNRNRRTQRLRSRQQIPAPIKSIPFIALNEDVWLMILANLPKQALRKISQTSKYFHALSIPLLFHTVDISVRPEIDIYSPSPRSWPSDLGDTLAKQWRFAKQLFLKPEYASYVRSFTWTTGLPCKRHPCDWTDDERAFWDPAMIYSLFLLLEKATVVDIDTGYRHPEQVPPTLSLFPSARHIRLGGKMHYALASAILHGSSKAPLTSLNLDNVIEGGLIRSPALQCSQGYRFAYTLPDGHGWGYNDYSLIKEDWPEGSFPVQVIVGPMRRLLTPSLQHRCRQISFLRLRKQGQQHPDQTLPSSLTFDDEVYSEWATFIRAVKPRILIFSHAGDICPPWSGVRLRSCAPLPPVQWPEIAPMDVRFQETLLPILREGWPLLERLEIQGVSRKVLGNLEFMQGATVKISENVEPCWNATVGMM